MGCKVHTMFCMDWICGIAVVCYSLRPWCHRLSQRKMRSYWLLRASVASKQQHNQDLKRIYKREYEFSNSSLFTRMHCIEQSALHHFLPGCIADEQHEDVIPSFRVDSSQKFCSDLPVKRSEGDCDWLSQLLFLFLMQYVKVCNSGRLIVTYYFQLSRSFLSNLASMVEF